MKEIEKVSISGISFMLDKEAYQIIASYLDRLHATYDGDPDGGEIIADIEARIAEIILSKQDAHAVVSTNMAQNIVDRLGMPDQDQVRASDANPPQTFARRLYRDPEGAKLGGVCSGLATFFDTDPVWIRLGAFIPLVALILTAPFDWNFLSALLGATVGVVPLTYLILWFAVPVARTPRQKLEMRGEKITASSIEDNFKQFSSPDSRSRKSASVWAEVIYVVGRIALFCIKAVAMIVAMGMVLVGVAFAVLAGAAVFASDKLVIHNHGVMEIFAGIQGATPQAYVVVMMFILLIPVMMLVIMLFRLIFERRMNGRTLSVLGGIWLILVIYFGIITIRNWDRTCENVTLLQIRMNHVPNQYRCQEPTHTMPADSTTVMPMIVNPKDSI